MIGDLLFSRINLTNLFSKTLPDESSLGMPYNKTMKMDLDLAKTTSLKNSNQLKKVIPPAVDLNLGKQGKDVKVVKNSPDYKIDLSLPSANPLPKLEVPELPSDHNTEKLPEKLLKKEVPSLTEKKIKEGTVKKDLVIFIKGLDLFSSPSTSESGYAGISKMADSLENSMVFKWNDKEAIKEKILSIHPEHKVILVGHSLGGDTAVEIADELDSLEHKFKKIDLLVTMDAVGMSNDIIPQNVAKHLNVFGETSFLLNDGPHVARRNEKTSVLNILSPKDHTEIDDDREIQFEVVSLIQETLSKNESGPNSR